MLLFLPVSAAAQAVERLDITVTLADNRPLRGVYVEVTHPSYGYMGSGETGITGVAEISGYFPDGIYDIYIQKGNVDDTLSRTVDYLSGGMVGGVFVQPLTVSFSSDFPFSADLLRLKLEKPNGSPVENMYVELSRSGSYVGSVTSGADGICTFDGSFTALPEGEYKIVAIPEYSYPPPIGGPYLETELVFSLSESSSSFLEGQFIRDVRFEIRIPERVMSISVFESMPGEFTVPDTTKPVSDVSVSINSFDDPDDYAYASTGSDGIARLPLTTRSSGRFSISAYSDEKGHTYREIDIPAGRDDFAATLVFPSVDAEIEVSLVDSSGDPVTAQVDENDYSMTWVHCYSVNGDLPLSFDGQVKKDESSVKIDVIGGVRYQCSAYFGEEYAVQEVEVLAVSDSTVAATLSITEAGALATFQFIDGNTRQPIVSDRQLDVSCWTDPYRDGEPSGPIVNHGAYSLTENATAQLSLIEGVSYYCYARFLTEEEQQFNSLAIGDYVDPGEFEIIAEQGLQRAIPLKSSDAQITLCLKGVDGQPVTRGFAYIFSPGSFSGGDDDEQEEPGASATPTPDGGGKAFDSDGDDSNVFDDIHAHRELDASGCAQIGAFSGREYFANAQPDGSTVDVIYPAERYVSPLETGESRELSFQLTQPNYTLTLTADPDSQFGEYRLEDVDFPFCYAEDGDGVFSFSESLETEALVLRLAVNKRDPQTFHVSCGLIFDDEEGGIGQGFFEDFFFTPKKRTESGAVAVLFDEAEPNFPESTAEVRNNTETRVTLPDGSKATFQVSAIAESGQGAFTYQSGRSSRAQSAQYDLLRQFDLKIRNDGELKERPNKPIQFCFLLDTEKLAELGVSPEAVKIGRIDEDTGRYILSETTIRTETDEDGSTRTFACGSLDHFSIWSTIIDVGEKLKAEAPSKVRIRAPRKVRAGKKKRRANNRKWRVVFTAPEGAEETSRFVFEYNFKKKQCRKGNFKKQIGFTGTGPLFVKSRKRSLCGRVKAVGGLASNTASRRRKVQ
ncbi:hypothetical protein MRY87_09150 [bacterium]|nr:hypothetical protein [bacterium]